MIFEEIVNEVCDRLNYSSDDAKARVGRAINSRYRRVTSSIGLIDSRRTQVSKAATVGNQLLVFSGIEKVNAVIDKSSGTDVVLEEITVDEMHNRSIGDLPHAYAIYSVTSTTVTIKLDCIPTTTFTLYADGLITVTTLNGSQAPAFSESFHDVLIYGAMADEYRKMEKVELAHDAETDFEHRLSDLRMFLAKSAYLDIYQSKNSIKGLWWKDNWN